MRCATRGDDPHVVLDHEQREPVRVQVADELRPARGCCAGPRRRSPRRAAGRCGSVASARASSRRLRWPVESVRACASRLLGEPHPVEQRRGPASRACRTSRVRVSAPTITLSTTVRPRERPQLLERARDAQAAHAIRREAGEAAAVQADLARVGAIEAADDLEQRRLARRRSAR